MFELRNGLAEVDMVHEEVALEVVEVGVQLLVLFGEFIDVLQGLVILELLLKNTKHEEVLECRFIGLFHLLDMRSQVI